MGFSFGLMGFFFFLGVFVYTAWGKMVNSRMEWPFPYGCCWSLSLHFFLCGLFLHKTNAISHQIETKHHLRIGLLMPEDFNNYDILLISLTSAIGIYMFFAWMKGMQAGHVEADARTYPWEEYAGMSVVDSAKYNIISFFMCGGGALAGYWLGKFSA
jgi:hypothetical protein